MIEPNDIVKVKPLDYENIEHPKEGAEYEAWKKLCEQYKKYQGKVFRIMSVHELNDQTYAVAENLTDKQISINGNEHAITFMESELEILETDYLNNCCREHLSHSAVAEDWICNSCEFNIGTMLTQYGQADTKQKATA